MILKPASLAAMVLAVLAFGVAGCGSDGEQTASNTEATATATEVATETATADPDNGADAGAKDKSCADAGDLEGEPKSKLPADVPLAGDARVYQSEGPFGKTMRYFAVTAGGPEDLPARRDDASDILVENFRPGVMKRLGLGYEVLKKLRAALRVAASRKRTSTASPRRLMPA